MKHVVTLPGKTAGAKTRPQHRNSLLNIVDTYAVGNIETMDATLNRVFSRDPRLQERRLCYLFNLSMIIDICGDVRKRDYLKSVLTSFQERNLCHSEFFAEAPPSSCFSEEDRRHLETAVLCEQEALRCDGLEPPASDNDLVMQLTRQNNTLKQKNKENRRTLQMRKRQRCDGVIKDRMLRGRNDDIFNMFKRICCSRDDAASAPESYAADPNAPTVDYAAGSVVAQWNAPPVVTTDAPPTAFCSNYDESDELFSSMYWTMVRNCEGYAEYLCDCISEYENQRIMSQHVEVVCPTCNRKELVHVSKFSSNWSCKHCGFYFSGATANSNEAQGDDLADVVQGMRDMHEQEMNRETALVTDIFTGCDYKTRQEYEYNNAGNKLNTEKHRINFQNYLREFLHPFVEQIDARHLELIRKEMELDNGHRPYDNWEDVNVTKLEQTLRRLNMKQLYNRYHFTLVYLLAVNKPPLLTNTLFDVFMDVYRRLSMAFMECKSEEICHRRTMIRNCYVFERTCEDLNITCFRKFYKRVKSSSSTVDHRRIYEWCCERAGLSYRPYHAAT